MADVVSPAVRSRMMAGIKSKNTKPELALRHALHAKGLRYRLHSKSIPGKPDMVFPRHRAAVFVNGCFWHGHDCKYFKLPATRTDFWEKKINGNQARDRVVTALLKDEGWRQLTVWECSLRGKGSATVVADQVAKWLNSSERKSKPDGLKRRIRPLSAKSCAAKIFTRKVRS
jgi:DNA mismatch endonuclease (patch repair protein)